MRFPWLLLLAMASTLAAGCDSKSTPAPSTTTTTTTTTTTPPTAVVAVTYTPNPATWSAGPGTSAACTTSANIWKFTYTFRESAGTAATLTSVTPTTDGVAQSAVSLNISVPASGSANVAAEICFPTSSQHTLQQVFSGTDSNGRAITFNGSVTFAAR